MSRCPRFGGAFDVARWCQEEHGDEDGLADYLPESLAGSTDSSTLGASLLAAVEACQEHHYRISCEMHRHVEQVLGKPSRPPRPRPPPRETLRERPRTLGPRAAPSLASGQRFAACAPPRTSQPHTPREAMNPRAPCTPSTGRPRPAWCQVKPCPVQEADDQSFREKWAAALAEIAEAVHRLRVLTGDEGDMLRDAAPPAPLAPPPPPLPLTKPEPHPVPPPLPRSRSHHVPHPPERPVCMAWESRTQRTWEAAEDIPRATAKAQAVHKFTTAAQPQPLGASLRDAAPPAPLAPPPPPLPLTKPEPHPVPPPLPRSWSHHVPHPPERPVCTAWEAGSCTQRTWEAAEDIPRATAKAQAVHKFTTAAQPQPLGASLYDSSPVTYAELQAAERWMPRSPAAAVPRWHLDGIQEATARAASSSRWRRTQATRGLRTEELLQSSQVSQREMREDPQHCLADLRLRLLSECDKKRLRLVIQSEKSSPTLAGRGQEGLTAKSCTVPWGDDVANSGHFRGKSAPSTESMFEPHQALDAMQAGCTEHDWQALDMKISMLPNLNVPTLGQDGATGGISTSAEDMLAADSHNPCKLSAKKEGMVGVTCPDGVWLTPSFQPFPSAISLGDAAECEAQLALASILVAACPSSEGGT
ncbi:unnamed protein product [Durusdinium trenchii]|uniref:Uncharacterized protein n=1 Tax=Durusdinium trenchii TaxID=1381693 RepID=A0ABP0HAP6_9DINO